MSEVALVNVTKAFGGTVVIPDLSLTIENGEFIVFVGPSGCGKSTLLRLIAGLEDVTEGTIRIGERAVEQLPPAKRGIAMVFQSYALYPHMTVSDNIAFGLEIAGFSKAERAEKIREVSEIVGLEDYLQRKPMQLSGGQRQRVAIARAIVRQPEVFLFDEPLSNLDAALRVQMRLEINRLHQSLASTMVYVTHDQTEAMTMADRIVVLNAGRIEQFGTPSELYNAPCNAFVAGFIGSPRMNFLHGEAARPYRAATIGIRPEHLDISRDAGRWKTTVGVCENLGSDTLVYVDGEFGPMTVRSVGETPFASGEIIYLTPDAERVHRFGADGRRDVA